VSRRRLVAAGSGGFEKHAARFQKPATAKQAALLKKLGRWKDGLSSREALLLIANLTRKT
jgi:hypothetical protein